jgi:hypothetical protein
VDSKIEDEFDQKAYSNEEILLPIIGKNETLEADNNANE